MHVADERIRSFAVPRERANRQADTPVIISGHRTEPENGEKNTQLGNRMTQRLAITHPQDFILVAPTVITQITDKLLAPETPDAVAAD